MEACETLSLALLLLGFGLSGHSNPDDSEMTCACKIVRMHVLGRWTLDNRAHTRIWLILGRQ